MTMAPLRERNRLPETYEYTAVMAALLEHGHRMAAGRHTMVATTRTGIGFRVVHYSTMIAVVYPEHALIRTGGWHTRPTAERLDRVTQPLGWTSELLFDTVVVSNPHHRFTPEDADWSVIRSDGTYKQHLIDTCDKEGL